MKFAKKVFDSVHGYIGLTDLEVSVMDTPLFQRLRWIKQLGPAEMVFPGATHTRFAHSIGTLYIADQFLGKIGDLNGLSDDYVQKVRLAALLHDIGHYPYSHTFEKYIKDRLHFRTHVEFGTWIIRKFLKEKLGSYSADEICSLIDGTSRDPAGRIISSSLDADKTDYLLRDAYYTGITEGKLDVQRLLKAISIDRKGEMIFEGDETALENFLLSRYYMFRNLYHETVVVSFSQMLTAIYKMMVEHGYVASPVEVRTESDVVGYTDPLIMARMQAARRSRVRPLREMADAFLSRTHPVLAWSYQAQSTRTPRQYSAVRDMAASCRRISRLAGVPEEWILPAALRPVSLTEDEIRIRRHGRVAPLTRVGTRLLKTFRGGMLYEARVYTATQYAPAVADAVRALAGNPSPQNFK